jgi:hypothetical protein
MFNVRWEHNALDELTMLWTQASSGLRQRITAATAQLDWHLQNDPWGFSESRRVAAELALSPRLESPFELSRMGKQSPSLGSGYSGVVLLESPNNVPSQIETCSISL